MKYLGIDYGKKNIGLAISDSDGVVSMPLKILKNNSGIKEKIQEVLKENSVDEIIIGESLDLNGKKNKIQYEIENFIIFFEKINFKVHHVNEIFTSMESKLGIEKKIRRNKKKNRKRIKDTRVDDRAASMILKTFLLKKK